MGVTALPEALERAHQRRSGYVSPGALEAYRRAREAGTLRDVLQFENSLINVVPLGSPPRGVIDDGPRAA